MFLVDDFIRNHVNLRFDGHTFITCPSRQIRNLSKCIGYFSNVVKLPKILTDLYVSALPNSVHHHDRRYCTAEKWHRANKPSSLMAHELLPLPPGREHRRWVQFSAWAGPDLPLVVLGRPHALPLISEAADTGKRQQRQWPWKNESDLVRRSYFTRLYQKLLVLYTCIWCKKL